MRLVPFTKPLRLGSLLVGRSLDDLKVRRRGKSPTISDRALELLFISKPHTNLFKESAMKTPVLVSFAQEDVHESKPEILMHFTERQWKSVLEKLPPVVRKVPKDPSIIIDIVEIPSDPVVVVGAITCPKGCNALVSWDPLPADPQAPGIVPQGATHVSTLISCSCPTNCHIHIDWSRSGVLTLACVNKRHQPCEGYSLVVVKTRTGYRMFCVKP